MRITTGPAMLVLALATILGLHGAIAADKQDTAKNPVKSELSIDRGRTAVLIMDYENQILGMLPEKTQAAVLDNASAILRQARQAHLPIIYVVVRFRDGYPEVSRQNKRFAGLKESGRLREGTPGAEIHARVAPQPVDIVVTKRRVGAFSTTDLESILRANNISTLALFGISTSGVVLSTVRWAADMDYQLVVVSDACADMDDEVHRVLTDKVFPGQATVVSTHEFVKALAAKPERGGNK
jgi:nicotinamidase-related amidase